MKKTITSMLLLLAFLLSVGSAKAQDTTQCHAFFIPNSNGLTVDFVDASFPGVSEITSWSWNFGDAATSTVQNPTHTYSAVGTYTITLDVSGSDCTSSYSLEIIVNDCNCTTDYNPVCVATPNGGIIEFGNECFAICQGYTPNNFVACDSDSTYACEAFFGYENDQTNAMAVSFMDFSWTMNPITSWAWDFGDGTTSTEQNPAHTYTDNGLFNTTLTITSEDCTSSMTMEVWVGEVTSCNCDFTFNPVCVSVDNEEMTFINACEAECYGFTDYYICDSTWTYNECEAFFGYYQQDFNSLNVQFEDYSYTSTPATSWSWDFGDGTTSTDQNPSHTFAQAGEHQVTMSIVSDSCETSVTETVYVGDFEFPECQAFFWPMQDSTSELSYTFLDFSFGATSWAWDFGDGATSTEQFPVHSFASAGTYNVVLTINGDNCESTFDLVLDTEDDLFFNVANPADANGAQALYTPVFGEDDNTVYFNNQSASSSPITNVEYNFGDGKVSSATNVSHIFPAKKAYNVSMKITNEAGDVSTFAGTIDLSSNTFVSTTGTSSIVLANPTIQADGFGLVLTPNPVVNELNIDFNLPATGGYNVEIQSITGQSLFNQSYQNTSGQNHLSLDVSDYAQGLYLVKLQANDAYKTFKFVKK